MLEGSSKHLIRLKRIDTFYTTRDENVPTKKRGKVAGRPYMLRILRSQAMIDAETTKDPRRSACRREHRST